MILDRSKLTAAAALVVFCAMPPAAYAQAPSYATRGETITGTIASVQNVNHIFVADDRGYTDDVTLRSGAVVLSGGLRLEPGVRVTIAGSSAGPTFLATRISTSDRGYGTASAQPITGYPVPVPVYYPDAAYYAAPAYYSYRPYFSAYFRFGSGYGPFYRGYGFGYGSFYRGYGYGYGPFYRGYGFGFGFGPFYHVYGYGFGPFYHGYGFGYGGFHRGYGFGYGPFNRGYGFGYGGFRGGYGFGSFSRGYGSFRGAGSFGVHGHFR